MLEQYQLQQKVNQTKLVQDDDQEVFQDLNNIDESPSSNFRGMAMQTAGFARSARSSNRPQPTPEPSQFEFASLSNAMGFVRAPRKVQQVVAPNTSEALPDLPPPPLQYVSPPANLPPPSPIPDVSNFASYSGMKSQMSGYVRPVNLVRNVAAPVDFVSDNPNLIVNVISAPSTPPPLKVAQPAQPVMTETVDGNSITGPELYVALDEVETKRQLRQLHDIYTSGFIQQYEYEHRKGQLERYLQKVAGQTESSDSSGKRTDRNVRVFLSSTFRDMQEERDQLIKHTFPQLRKFCSERGIFFSEIDLRWGITAEQSERGEVLGLCLQEIDKCRPYFINILGSRYGYVPQAIPAEIRQKYRWLPDTDSQMNDKSVTEFEVMYGALNNVMEASRAYFYFRDGAKVDDTTDDVEKVEILKSKIRSCGLPNKPYKSVEELANAIFTDLKDAIECDFPKGEEPSDLDIENFAHSTYAESRRRVYIPKYDILQKLYNYLQDDNTAPVALIGESGIGKSTTLANWSSKLQSKSTKTTVITHFVGCSSSSGDYSSLMMRVLSVMRSQFKIDEEVPTDKHQLLRTFNQWLVGRIPSDSRLVLIIDAVNQLDTKEDSHDLHWLPENIQSVPNLKVVVSTTPDSRTHAALKKRKWNMLQMPYLEIPEKENFIVEYLAQFGKSFDNTQLQRIVSASQTKNGLFLKVLLEELRIHGVYEELNKKINFYLQAYSIQDLFQKVLERLEQDFDSRHSRMVGDTMALIFCSRRGLSESEILTLLRATRMAMSPFLFSIQEFIVNRGGMLNFFHDYLRQAVEAKYLSTESAKNQYRRRLVQFFEGPECNPDRRLVELPWLLYKMGDTAKLSGLLSDMDVFLKLYTKSRKYELKSYWLTLIQQRVDVSNAYLNSTDYYARRPDVTDAQREHAYRKSARFLRELVYYEPAEKLYSKALEIARRIYGEEHINVAKLYYLTAEMYWNQGKWDLAEPNCNKALQIREKLLGPNHPSVAMALVGLGEMEMRKESHVQAQKLIERALQIRIDNYGPDHPLVARCLQDLSIICDNRGYSDKAIQLCSRALQIREKCLGLWHPHVATSLETLGSIYKLRHESDKAEPLMRRALDINVRVHGEFHPSTATTCEWLSLILRELNKLEEAQEFEKRARKIQEKIGDVGERIAD